MRTRCGIMLVTMLVCAAAAAAPIDVIFDTDMGNDVDDVLALGLIHAIESRGECRLLAVTITKDEPLAAAFTDAVNTFYGRPDVPIGIVRGGPTPGVGKFLPLASARENGMPVYPHDLDGARAADAVQLLRETLAGRPDGSVVIVQVGFSTNLARLLDAPPDDVSPLSGRELAAAKVRLLSVMGGAFTPIKGERHGEFNLVQDITAAQKIATSWPTPIVWSGFEVGAAILYPAVSIERDYGYVKHHPLSEAYVAYTPPPHCRPTWDLTSVLHAVRPDRGYFQISEPGRVVVEDDGGTRFEPAADGPHRHLIASPQQAARAVETFAALCSQPPTRAMPSTVALGVHRVAADPVRVILDTDMSGDCDDAGAIAVLHALADRGEAEILATVVNRKDLANASAAATSAINTWYGRPDIPIGADKAGPTALQRTSPFTPGLRDGCPHRAQPDDEMPDALDVYRRVLAAQPDGTVTVCCVGAFSNLAALCRSEPALVRAKVHRLVVMGGMFPAGDTPETNIATHPEAARIVAAEWPTEIAWQGFHVGDAVITGAGLKATPAANPVRRAYELRRYAGRPSIEAGQPSYDQAAVLYAVRGPDPALWREERGGHVVVDQSGSTRWEAGDAGRHVLVHRACAPEVLARLIEALMTAAP